MVNFKINGKAFAVASSWSDLQPRQLWPVVPFAYTSRENMATRLQLLYLLVPGCTPKLYRKLTDQQRLDVLQLTDWVFDQAPSVTGIEHFDFKGVRYCLPKRELDDTIAVEFAMADLFFKDFARDSDPKLLDKLVATLCRPLKAAQDLQDPAWDGVARHRYNGAIADRQAMYFADLPFSVKVIVLHHFAEMQRMVHSTYDIFSASGGSGGGGDGFNIGWMSVIFDLAEQGIFGDFDKTCFTNINTLCLYLHKKRQDRSDEK